VEFEDDEVFGFAANTDGLDLGEFDLNLSPVDGRPVMRSRRRRQQLQPVQLCSDHLAQAAHKVPIRSEPPARILLLQPPHDRVQPLHQLRNTLNPLRHSAIVRQKQLGVKKSARRLNRAADCGRVRPRTLASQRPMDSLTPRILKQNRLANSLQGARGSCKYHHPSNLPWRTHVQPNAPREERLTYLMVDVQPSLSGHVSITSLTDPTHPQHATIPRQALRDAAYWIFTGADPPHHPIFAPKACPLYPISSFSFTPITIPAILDRKGGQACLPCRSTTSYKLCLIPLCQCE